ncbi:MAG: biotin--[acetyl-CoA-carboxylase] ligase [Oscillospiraceae bacterium]|nr:biotin--[acetyl-CoA-carboxylase] ligase [Oscillospiraceae bacterium]
MDFSTLHRAAPVVYKPCVTSTNTLVKGLVPSGIPDGFTLVAASQIAGKGRLGRSFQSPQGGLYLSMLRFPRCPLEQTAQLTPCVGVAVCRAIERVCGLTPEIKWPNDLLLGGKKLCGILLESSSFRGSRFVVVGVGINVNTAPSDFPEELRESATSLAAALGREVDLQALALAEIEELDAMYAQWQTDPACCLDDYRRLCVSTNRAVTLIENGSSRPAFARSIDENYSLIVEVDGREQHISTGEVSLRNA